MKIIKELIKYSFIILFISSSSCDGSDEQEIPSGNHSFYCYIDGNLFVPRGNPNITTSPSNDGLRISITDNFYQIEANDYSNYVVFINLKDINLETINLSESSGSFYDFNINHAIIKKDGLKYLSKNSSGSIILSDNSNENVIGTFEFTLYNENDESDTIQITNGHFDD